MDLQGQLNSYNQAFGQSQQAQNNLQNFQGSEKSASDFYNQAQQQYNIPGLTSDVSNARNAVTNTQQLINNLPGAVSQQTRGQMVNEGQRQALLGSQMQPLQGQYNAQNNAYGNAQNLYQNNLAQAMNQANMGFQGQNTQYGQLNQLYQNALARQQQAAQNYQFGQTYQQQQQSINATTNLQNLIAQQQADVNRAIAQDWANGQKANTPVYPYNGANGLTPLTGNTNDPNSAISKAIQSTNQSYVTNPRFSDPGAQGLGSILSNPEFQNGVNQSWGNVMGVLNGLGKFNPFTMGGVK